MTNIHVTSQPKFEADKELHWN